MLVFCLGIFWQTSVATYTETKQFLTLRRKMERIKSFFHKRCSMALQELICYSTKDPVLTVCTFLRVLLQSNCSSPITGTKYQWAAGASFPKEFYANLLKMRTITISGLLGNFLKLPANSSQASLWFWSKGHHLYLPAIPVAVSTYWVLHRKQLTYECQQCWDVVKLCFTLRGWLFSEIFWTSNECKSLLNKNSAGSLLLSFYWVSKKCQDLNKPLNYFYRQYEHSWNTSYPNSK